MAKVSAYVYVHTADGTVLLAPGDDVPKGAEVTNKAALVENEKADEKDEKPATRRKAASE